MIYFIFLFIVLFAGIIIDRIFLKSDGPVLCKSDDFTEELSDEVNKFNFHLKAAYLAPTFEAAPFDHFEINSSDTEIRILDVGMREHDSIIRKCTLTKEGAEYEVWCKVLTRWGKFEGVDWEPRLEDL